MKSALMTATLVATSHAAASTCDWVADTAGTGWVAGLTCKDGFDCCSPNNNNGFDNDRGKLEQACITPLLAMTGPTPDSWGTNSPVDAVCCPKSSGFSDSENACNIGLGKGYAGASGNAKPTECPKGSSKCGGDVCIIVGDDKYCKDDKLIDNTCDGWLAFAQGNGGDSLGPLLATACGAVTWTDVADKKDKACDKADTNGVSDCKYASYKTGVFTDAKKSTNKDAKLLCIQYSDKEDKKHYIKPFGETKGDPENAEGENCYKYGDDDDMFTKKFIGCVAPDTTKQGCPGYNYASSARKEFYPDDACPCNTYTPTDASSATSAALSVSAIIGAGLLALL